MLNFYSPCGEVIVFLVSGYLTCGDDNDVFPGSDEPWYTSLGPFPCISQLVCYTLEFYLARNNPWTLVLIGLMQLIIYPEVMVL